MAATVALCGVWEFVAALAMHVCMMCATISCHHYGVLNVKSRRTTLQMASIKRKPTSLALQLMGLKLGLKFQGCVTL